MIIKATVCSDPKIKPGAHSDLCYVIVVEDSINRSAYKSIFARGKVANKMESLKVGDYVLFIGDAWHGGYDMRATDIYFNNNSRKFLNKCQV